MKDQYFGDARDYLKYHLIEELLGRAPGLERLLFLWMLTPPDRTQQGNVRFLENSELPALTSFLQSCLERGDRRVRNMREYYASRGIDYTPWGDEPPYFGQENRRQYFQDLPGEALSDALVFFDPDVGLRDSSPTPKHLLFDELIQLRERTNVHSITVVFQYFLRRKLFWEGMANEIRERLGAPVAYVADPAVAFYVIPNNEGQMPAIEQALSTVAAAATSRRFYGFEATRSQDEVEPASFKPESHRQGGSFEVDRSYRPPVRRGPSPAA